MFFLFCLFLWKQPAAFCAPDFPFNLPSFDSLRCLGTTFSPYKFNFPFAPSCLSLSFPLHKTPLLVDTWEAGSKSEQDNKTADRGVARSQSTRESTLFRPLLFSCLFITPRLALRGTHSSTHLATPFLAIPPGN